MGTDRTRTAVLATVLLAALGLGVALLRLAPDADRLPAGGRAVPVLVVAIGWAFVGRRLLRLAPAPRQPHRRAADRVRLHGPAERLRDRGRPAALPRVAPRRPARDRRLPPPAAGVPVRAARGPGRPASWSAAPTPSCSRPSSRRSCSTPTWRPRLRELPAQPRCSSPTWTPSPSIAQAVQQVAGLVLVVARHRAHPAPLARGGRGRTARARRRCSPPARRCSRSARSPRSRRTRARARTPSRSPSSSSSRPSPRSRPPSCSGSCAPASSAARPSAACSSG